MFQVFGVSHLTALAITFLGVLCLIWQAPKLSQNIQNWIRRVFILGLIFHIFYYYIGHYLLDSFIFPTHIQLHLCSMGIYLCLWALLTSSESIKKIFVLISPLAALVAVASPVLSKDFPSFAFMEFFISHILIIWSGFYISFVEKIKPTYFWVFKALIVLVVYSGLAMILYFWWQANYFYLRDSNPLPAFFPDFPLHLVYILVFSVLGLHLSYLIFGKSFSIYHR